MLHVYCVLYEEFLIERHHIWFWDKATVKKNQISINYCSDLKCKLYFY